MADSVEAIDPLAGASWMPQPTFRPETETDEAGNVTIELEHYTIRTIQDSNWIEIRNKDTGEVYVTSGDPHEYVGGGWVFDFNGTMTKCLEDGTKITIATEKWEAGGGHATLAESITVTNYAQGYGVKVSGIASNRLDDLKVTEVRGMTEANRMDRQNRDGFKIQENSNGEGWVAVERGTDGVRREVEVDQAYVDRHDPMRGGTLDEGSEDIMELMTAIFAAASCIGGSSAVGAATEADNQTNTSTRTP